MNNKSKAFLAYLVIFLVGAASGFFLNYAIRPPAQDDFLGQSPGINGEYIGPGGERGFGRGRGMGRMQERMGDYFARELDLDESQREPFFNELNEHLTSLYEGIRKYRSEEVDLVRNQYAQFVDNVDEILTEEQLEELNRIAHPDSVQNRRVQRRRQGQFRR